MNSPERDMLMINADLNRNNNFRDAFNQHIINSYNFKMLTYFEAYLKNRIGDDYWIKVTPTTNIRSFNITVQLASNGYTYRDSDIESIINQFKMSLCLTYDCRFRLRYCNWKIEQKTIVVDVTIKHLNLIQHWELQFVQLENNKLMIIGCQTI